MQWAPLRLFTGGNNPACYSSIICCFSEGHYQKCMSTPTYQVRHYKVQFRNIDTDKQMKKHIQRLVIFPGEKNGEWLNHCLRSVYIYTQTTWYWCRKGLYVNYNRTDILCILLFTYWLLTVCIWTYVVVYKKRKEGNVLFNDAFNTFTVIWRQTYGKGPFR